MLAGCALAPVRAAYEEYLAGWDENGAEWAVWVERADAARAAFARLLHAEPTELAVTTSVTQGVSGDRQRSRPSARPRIVISEYEFPTVGQIAHAQELRGAEVVHVRPEPDGSIPPERFAEAIDERTALVCCTTVSYRTGHRHDVAEIARLAHDAGALCLADSYQAVGAIDFDAHALGVDFATGGTVKYLLGSSGPRLPLRAFAELLPDAAPDARPAGSPTRTSSRWTSPTTRPPRTPAASTPARRPCRTSTRGLAGMSLIEEAGTAAIEEHVAGLADRLIEGLEELGALRRHAARPGPARPARLRPLDRRRCARRRARAERITCSERDANLRISLHLYNVEDDVDRVLDALRRNRSLLAQ